MEVEHAPIWGLRGGSCQWAGPAVRSAHGQPKQREVLALLPVADVQIEAVDLGLFQLEIIIDEEVAEARAQRLVVAEGGQRLGQRARQRRRLGFIGRVGRRAGIERAVEPVQPAHDLARHVEVGVGRRLADPVFQVRRGIARAAQHAHHDAAVVAPPGGAVGRQREGAVALVAVQGRRAEGGRPACMGEQARHVMPAHRRQRFASVHEGVGVALPVGQRLVQVPAARHDVGELGPAHEGGVIAVALRHLLGGAPEQHHGVGRRQAGGGAEGELDLARPDTRPRWSATAGRDRRCWCAGSPGSGPSRRSAARSGTGSPGSAATRRAVRRAGRRRQRQALRASSLKRWNSTSRPATKS